MVELTVYVSGWPTERRLLTLPVDVYAPDGTVLASGVASAGWPTQFELSPRAEGLDRVHVLGRLPNGETLQQTAELHGSRGSATLDLGNDSPHEWLQWVAPFRSLHHLQTSAVSGNIPPRRIGKVWMTLWALRDGRWEAQDARAVDRRRDNGMQMIVLDLPQAPHLLQIGGEEVAWRLVALPPGGPVRVALTRSPTEEGDTLEITIGRSEPDNDLIMSYLARGAISDANRLAEAWNAADLSLYAKRRDPVAAAAGAYLLLKDRRLQRRRHWVDNLVEWVPYLADGAIVSAALALQRDDKTEADVRKMLEVALERGLPIFAMGATVLVETMAAIHRGKKETKRFHAAYLAAQAYARARCSTGAYFAFYGKSPAEPSWTPIYGLEGSAATNPASAEPREAVVYARPWDGIRAGKFGSTRVALPRAPVSASVVEALRSGGSMSDDRQSGQMPQRPDQRPIEPEPLFRRTVDLGIPVVETSFLQEFSAASERGIPRVASQAPSRRHDDLIAETPKSMPAERLPRQTPKYWREERRKHATSVFDGEE